MAVKLCALRQAQDEGGELIPALLEIIVATTNLPHPELVEGRTATKRFVSLAIELARQAQKVAEHCMPIFRQNGFRVKLHAVGWMAGVSKAHDLTCIRMRRHG